MDRRALGELLNEYVDGLIAGSRTATDAVGRYPADGSSAAGLFSLTDDLASLLVPVKLTPEFIQELGESLASAAAPAETAATRPSARKLWLGALVSGSLVSAVGVLVVWWMRRGRGSAVTAA